MVPSPPSPLSPTAPETSKTSSASTQSSTAAIAHVREKKWGYVLLVLPRDHANIAMSYHFRFNLDVDVTILDNPSTTMPDGSVLGPDRWCFFVRPTAALRVFPHLLQEDGHPGPNFSNTTGGWYILPRYHVRIPAGSEYLVRRALYDVIPEEFDERGLPVAWVKPEAPKATLASGRSLIDDVEMVPDGDPLPPVPPGDDVSLQPDDDTTIRAALRALCRLAKLPDVPLEVKRPTHLADGFVGGRIYSAPSGPRKIVVSVDANADAAEVWATLIHEVAHAIAPTAGHKLPFIQAMVALAEQRFGTAWFAHVHAIGNNSALADAWVAVGVRAALRNQAPPAPEEGDEGQLAKVVDRIQKLRRLARAQPGTPEGRSACAMANDLLIRWDLGAYSVRLQGGIDDQMCDRWVDVGKRSVWRRQLAFVVSTYCGVFALTRKSKGWIHYFGRYADVVTAEWFYETWSAHIERAADAHMERFNNAAAGARRRKNPRSEKVDFCDSAVIALARKLKAVTAAMNENANDEDALPGRARRAERFAAEQFDLRGTGWSSGGSGKTVNMNSAGLAAGESAPLSRGIHGSGGVKGFLGD